MVLSDSFLNKRGREMPIDTETLAKIEANKRQWREGIAQEKDIETAERQESFRALKEGIIKKFVANELDLEDRQEQSILKLVDKDSAEDASLSHGYFHACTAFGKTYLMMAMAEGYRAEAPHKKIIILEENTKVLEQVKQDFIDKTGFSFSEIGAFYGKEKTADTPIVVGTYASMEKMINAVGKENIGLVLCDEAHHILSENRRRVAQVFNSSCLYGFTATPEYDKDKDCADVFGKVIDSVTLREGVEEGLLCSFKNGLFVSKIPVDLTDAINNSGDYDGEKLAEILKQSHLHGIREELADYYLTSSDPIIGKIKGKPTIINVPNQHEADELATVFNHKAGYNIAQAYHTNSGESPLQEFNSGKFPVLIQVNRVTEGYSNKKVEVCINYPTASKVKAAQRGGRALRQDKENPDKVALIMDIAFKRNNNKSTLEEIRENGQVLFMDIAEDVAIISSNMRPKIAEINKSRHKNTNQDKDEVDTTHLFDVVVDMEDLYDMNFTKLIHEEENMPQRNKLDTDLISSVFRNQWILQQNGKSLDYEEKIDLWDQVIHAKPELFTYVQARNGRTHDVISQEQQNAFKQYLQEQGYDVTTPDEKYQSIERDKLDTDLVSDVFRSQWSLKKNGKSLSPKEKSNLWEQIIQAKLELFTYVQSGSKKAYVISKEKQQAFKLYLQKQGYDVTTPDEKYQSVERNKLDTDLIRNVFKHQWLLQQNGKSLSPKEKSNLWEQIQMKLKLFTCVKSGPKQVYVISKEKQNAFKQYLQEQGYDVTTPDEKYQRVERDKLDTDLVSNVFRNQWILQQNGKSLNGKEKGNLWEQIQTKLKLFTYVQAGPQQIYVVSKEQQNTFKQYLQEQGYDVTTPYEKYQSIERDKLDTDLGKVVFQRQWILQQKGKTLTPKEKNNLWEQIIQENPELFTFIQAGANQAYVISQEQQQAFKQYLQEQGYDVTTPDEKYQSIERDKLDTDLISSVFQNQWILKQNGKSLDKKEKSNLWEQIQTKLKLFTFVQAGKHQAYVISKEKQNAFKQYLQEQGYEVTTPYDKLHEAQEQAAQAQTPEERKKYLVKAKKIFESLNPKTAKDNTCEICLNKISQSRE